MKNLLLVFFTFFVCSISNSQLTIDFPFKTYLDSLNNLNVTGNDFNELSNSMDITLEKYNSSGINFEFRFYENFNGNDRGMDIAVDVNGNSYITGFIFNTKTQSNDIIILKYNSLGNLVWDQIIESPGDDKSYTIEIIEDQANNVNKIFIAGYKFVEGSQTFTNWGLAMPSDNNGGTVTAIFYWTTTVATGNVVWGIAGRAFNDGDVFDQAVGTPQTVTVGSYLSAELVSAELVEARLRSVQA